MKSMVFVILRHERPITVKGHARQSLESFEFTVETGGLFFFA